MEKLHNMKSLCAPGTHYRKNSMNDKMTIERALSQM